MVRKTNPSHSPVKPPPAALAKRPPDEPPGSGSPPLPIIERPDGYYWQASDGHQEVGPFETYEQAQADRDAMDEEGEAPSEALQDAEQEIGIADWIDPDTGEPAEGESPPRLPPD